MTNKKLEMTSRVADQVKTNTQLFLDELWKQSNKGREVVDIDLGELDESDWNCSRIAWAYLFYLKSIGCIDYDCYYPGGYYLVTVKQKEETDGTDRRKED